MILSDGFGGAGIWGVFGPSAVASAGGGGGNVGRVECSPQGNQFAFPASRDIWVGSFTTESISGVLRNPEPAARPYFMAFSPDGTQLAIPSGGHILMWDVQAGTLARQFERLSGDLVWSNDGRWLAYHLGEGQIRVFDVETDQDVLTLSPPEPLIETYVNDLAFSPDSSQIAAILGDRQAIYVWDTATGEIVQTYPFATSATDLAWSPDGTRLYHNGGPEGIGVFVNGLPFAPSTNWPPIRPRQQSIPGW